MTATGGAHRHNAHTAMTYTALGEFRVLTIRETRDNGRAKEPRDVARYWRAEVEASPAFDSMKEHLVAIMRDTRGNITGHHVVAVGTLDGVNVHAREVFRPAIVAGAHGIILAHNHPSGDPSPSEADLRITRTLMQAGRILGIAVEDHVIMGRRSFRSLRELMEMDGGEPRRKTAKGRKRK